MKEKDLTQLDDKGKLSPAEKYELDENDKKILAILIQFEEEKPTYEEIGLLLKPPMTKQAVHWRINKPSFKKALKDYYDNWESLVIKAQRAALRKITNQVNDSDPKISQEACKFLLTPKFVKQVDQMPIQLGQQIIISTEMAPNGALLRKVSVEQIATTETPESQAAEDLPKP